MACSALRPHHPHSYHRVPEQSQKSPVPCKFWLQGRCSRSDSCRFSHAMANTSATPPPSRSATRWTRPTVASPAQAAPLLEMQQQSEEEASPCMPMPTEISAVAPPEARRPSTHAIEATISATATGISAVNWPLFVMTLEDGSLAMTVLERPGKRILHKLHAAITCKVDGPVQKLLHPGFLLLGLASGEIAVVSEQLQQPGGGLVVQIIPGPPQPCGKVLCLVSGRTTEHPLLLIAGYENGAILCWNFDATASAFSPLCALQHPTAASIVSMDISDNYEFRDMSSSVGQKKQRLLYSASADGCITVWDLDTFSRLQLLPHATPITKLLTNGRYLFCGCADGSIKVWGPSSIHDHDHERSLEMLYTQPSPRRCQAAVSVVGLCGQHINGSPMLFAAYSDHTVSMWGLPSFIEVDVLHVSFGVTAMDVATRSHDGCAVLLLAGTQGSATFSMIQRKT